jgi:hypothetical protein
MNELLLNIELEVFSLIGKRTKKANKNKIYKELNTENKNKNNVPFISYETNNDLVKAINFDHTLNSKIVSLYLELMYNNILNIKFEDIDILNLIVKYIKECEKQTETYLKDTYYVCGLEFEPKMAIKELSTIYFHDKYNSTYCQWLDKTQMDIDLFLKLFFNIIIPLAKEQVNHVYFGSLSC